jgi:leucyl aminopeptidase
VLVETTTDGPLATDADTIVVGVFEGERVAHDVAGEALQRLLDSGEARSSFKRIALIHADHRRFLIAGLGDRARFDPERARLAAALAHRRARELGTRTLCWELPHHVGDGIVAGLVEGTLLHAYRFERYQADHETPRLERLIVSAHHDVGGAAHVAAVTVTAQNRARDLGNTPANDLPPERLAAYAIELAERSATIGVEVLDERAIRDAGMGAFAAVAQGSAQEARLIKLEYAPAPAPPPAPAPADDSPLLALIGKAVTFDSGGLTLKPPASMHEMKFDMCGGAAVIEAIAAVAELDLPVRLLGVVGATENLPSGIAIKPGDIVTALDGTTIEVNNPDAEGRLVLADCITYARREGAQRLVDIATLTGIKVALGTTYAGVWANDDAWAERVQACAASSGELVWRMPLHEQYAEMVKGQYAQLTNRTVRREAMPTTAAEFLHHFAGDTPWAHLDIAATAYDVPRDYFVGKGATGFGVRLMVDLARSLAA